MTPPCRIASIGQFLFYRCVRAVTQHHHSVNFYFTDESEPSLVFGAKLPLLHPIITAQRKMSSLIAPLKTKFSWLAKVILFKKRKSSAAFCGGGFLDFRYKKDNPKIAVTIQTISGVETSRFSTTKVLTRWFVKVMV